MMPLLVTRGQSVDISTFPMAMFKRVRITRGGIGRLCSVP